MKAIVFIGRVQPPTVAHKILFDILNDSSLYRIVFIVEGVQTSKNKQINPLTGDERKKILKPLYPNIRFEIVSSINECLDVLDILGLSPEVIVCGSDRSYSDIFKCREVMIERNEISATLTRQHVTNNDFATFEKTFITSSYSEFVYNLLRERLCL